MLSQMVVFHCFFRVGTLPTTMELEANPSTERNFLTRTSSWSTEVWGLCPWLTPGPTPTGPSSSSAQLRPTGESFTRVLFAFTAPVCFRCSSHILINSCPLQAQREARGVWQRRGGHWCCQGDREARHKERHSESQGCHCWLWSTLIVQQSCCSSPVRCILYHAHPSSSFKMVSICSISRKTPSEPALSSKNVRPLCWYPSCCILYLLICPLWTAFVNKIWVIWWWWCK